MELGNVLDPRLLIVTGKGGVGKSTVAASLAVAAARSGRRTCLVEVEGRQTMARLFGTQAWDFTEREFRPGLWGLAIDPEASLVEYLDMFYGAKRLSKLVVGSTAVEFATSAAPGIKDVLLIGKIYEMEKRRDADGRYHYDLIVMDAPPTGRIVNFLRAPEATTALVNVGPIQRQADGIVEMLTDGTRTHLQLVTLLEEMPVQETVESVAALEELDVTLGPLIVNRVLAERFDEPARKALTEDLAPDELCAVLADAGITIDADGAAALRELGDLHLQRLELQERMRTALDEQVDLPRVELPYLYGAEFAADELARLARVIEEAADL
jgi:anion-transporting  ArsA/GET3 family ATPase